MHTTFVPLVTAGDGSAQPVEPLGQPFTLTFDNGTPTIPGNNAPVQTRRRSDEIRRGASVVERRIDEARR